MRIGFFSCQGWQPGYYTAHAGLAGEDLDLVVSLGDYIYELTDDDGPREDTIGPNGDGEAQTLAEYRAEVPPLPVRPRTCRRCTPRTAFACVWDDHEIESGWQRRARGRDPGPPAPRALRGAGPQRPSAPSSSTCPSRGSPATAARSTARSRSAAHAELLHARPARLRRRLRLRLPDPAAALPRGGRTRR